jgi:hypothetical protein
MKGRRRKKSEALCQKYGKWLLPDDKCPACGQERLRVFQDIFGVKGDNEVNVGPENPVHIQEVRKAWWVCFAEYVIKNF